MARMGKGLSDRTVFITATNIQAVQAYLEVRGQGPSQHVFLYRNLALSKDLVHGRMKLAGERVEQRLDLVGNLADGSEPVSEEQGDELQALAGQVVAASLNRQGLPEIITRMRLLVFGPVGAPTSSSLADVGAIPIEFPP